MLDGGERYEKLIMTIQCCDSNIRYGRDLLDEGSFTSYLNNFGCKHIKTLKNFVRELFVNINIFLGVVNKILYPNVMITAYLNRYC